MGIDTSILFLIKGKYEKYYVAQAIIYPFLPTRMVIGLPLIIDSNFLLIAFRESIKWDRKWN